MKLELLKQLCNVHAPSGNEGEMTNFLLKYIEENKKNWVNTPTVLSGEEFQDCVILIFGKPRTAIFAHIDSIGYMVRYGRQLIPIGGPASKEGIVLKGRDSVGDIHCTLALGTEDRLEYQYEREIERGTELVFKSEFRMDEEYVQSCYLDNRLGVWNALKVAETLEDGAIVFSCWEEHGGGSVAITAKYLYEKYQLKQALISDITWITEGVEAGKGAAISIRDRSIPRRKFVDKIIELVKESQIDFQLEVEEYGGSDGKELQSSPYPYNWCFIGAAEQNVHSPEEKVHLKDIESMVEIYKYLMKRL